jgi:hypothetical protein
MHGAVSPSFQALQREDLDPDAARVMGQRRIVGPGNSRRGDQIFLERGDVGDPGAGRVRGGPGRDRAARAARRTGGSARRGNARGCPRRPARNRPPGGGADRVRGGRRAGPETLRDIRDRPR